MWSTHCALAVLKTARTVASWANMIEKREEEEEVRCDGAKSEVREGEVGATS